MESLFRFYSDLVKPLYAEIEARNNTIPVELLFEIHSAFDHISRIYSKHENIEKSIGDSYGHLIRGCLDAFKLKLKYYNSDLIIFKENESVMN
jgi:hypothetical protein